MSEFFGRPVDYTGTEVLVKLGSKHPDITDIHHEHYWRDGQIVQIRPLGYHTGRRIGYSLAVTQFPNLSYQQTGGRTELDWEDSTKNDLNKYERAVDDYGLYPWENDVRDDKPGKKTDTNGRRKRDWFVDFQHLLNEGYITQAEFDRLYDFDEKSEPIVIPDVSFDNVFQREDEHHRLNDFNDRKHASVSSGTYSIGSGLDYDDVAAFETDIAAQLTGNLTGEHNDEETSVSSAVTFDTDTNSYLLKLTAQSGDAHDGTFGNATHQSGDGARLTIGHFDSIIFEETSDGDLDDVEVSDLVFDCSGAGLVPEGVQFNDGGDSGEFLMHRCIFKGNNSADTVLAYVYYKVTNWQIRNCISYGATGTNGRGFSLYAHSAQTGKFFNNTAIGCTVNIYNASASGSLTTTNNLAQDGGTDYSGSFGTTSKNVSEDATSPNASYRSKNCHDGNSCFVDYANDDYHLDSGGDEIDDLDDGDDLSGTFSDDIDGDTRSTWYIGADEITTSGLSISPTSISSTETFGSFTITTGTVNVSPSGIASEESFGSFTISNIISISINSISSEETFGSFTLGVGSVTIAPSSITSAEAFGSFTITTGIISVEPTGIGSSEVFGSFSLSVGSINISPSGIASTETFGSFTITTGSVNVSPNGIDSEEAFGSFSVGIGITVVYPNSIISGESFGSLTIATGATSIIPSGISSEEGFGSFTIQPGSIIFSTDGIGSAEFFGSFSLSLIRIFYPNSIGSSEAFGSFTVSGGSVVISPTGIPSSESFGSFSIGVGSVSITPIGIVSGESFGLVTIANTGYNIYPDGIGSSESFGVLSIIVGVTTIEPTGIISGESFGTFSLYFGQLFTLDGIPSGEDFGDFQLIYPQDLVPTSILSSESFGGFQVIRANAPGLFDQFETDIEEVFLTNNADFAEQVEVHYLPEDSTNNIMAIFDQEYLAADVDGNFAIQTKEPLAIIQTRKLQRKLKRGDYLVVRGVTWEVVSSEPDGTGISEIRLHHKV